MSQTDGFHENPNHNRYFISYIAAQGAIGNCQVNLRHPIRNSDDVATVTRLISESNGIRGLIITNFRRFDSD